MAIHRSLIDGYEDDLAIGRVYAADVMAPVTSQDASVDGQGGSIRGKPVFDIAQVAYYLNRGDGLITEGGVTYRSGANWDGAQGVANNDYYTLANSKGHVAGTALTELAFGFYETKATLPDPYVYTRADDGTNAQYVGFAVANGFSALDAEQRQATRDAIQSWDDLITVKFVEKPFGSADLNFMNTTTGPAQASAYLPYDYGRTGIVQDDGTFVTYEEISGDVFINPNQASNHVFDEGQYGLTTLIHEIGHTLGLEHPGAYNFGPGFSVTYENGAEYYQDSNQYSIMSYWDSEETGANHVDWEFLTYRYSSTPSVHDVAAIQRIYGADMTTRTGDTVYGFNSNAGRDSYDFNLTPVPVVTIWDAGGNDTLDLSGYATPSVININEGAFTSAGGFYSLTIPTLAEINTRRAAAGLTLRTQATYDLYLEITGSTYNNGLMTDNIAIAYGAVIENAIGGTGNDIVIANQVANRLDGGAGIDTVSFETATAGVFANLTTGTASGGSGNDTLLNFENLTGSKFNDVLTGTAGANVLDGGAGFDIVTLEGNRSDYTFKATGTNLDMTVTNTRSGVVDTIRNVELFNFADGSYVGADKLLNAGIVNGKAVAPDTYGQIMGTTGNDGISGSDANDRLVGGTGVDALLGGAGSDTFILRATDFSASVAVQDLIYDFTNAGRYSATDNDFLALTGFGSGAKLVFDHYGKSGSVVDNHLQYYHVEAANGDVFTIFVKSVNGQLLNGNDYAFYG